MIIFKKKIKKKLILIIVTIIKRFPIINHNKIIKIRIVIRIIK